MTSQDIKLYVVLNSNESLWERYQARDTKWMLNYISEHLPGPQRRPLLERLRITALPSAGVSAPARERRREPESRPRELVVALVADRHASKVVEGVHEAIRSDKRSPAFAGSGADLPFAGAEHWCPSEATNPFFSNRLAAEVLLRVPYLRDQKRLRGRHVNVVVVDQGLDKARLGNSYADGWQVGNTMPGVPHSGPDYPHGGHGMMVARNILSVAPEARLFDLPMLPLRIGDIQEFFLNRADAAFRTMLDGIEQFKIHRKWPGPWVLVNAWAIYDRKTEWPIGDYTNNPSHHFHALVAEAASAGIDVIFAAGNCGQFCPSGRCGARDRGPGNSILGANSYGAVLTVGAVRSDAMWLGYSSQGPGQPRLERAKPDLCASSQFRENDDAYVVNTGTSTSAALAAGVVAALRGKWDSARVSPQQLKQILNSTARPAANTGPDDRYGNGILDAARSYDELKAQFP